MNRRKLLLGAAAAALLITSPSLGAYLPLTTSMIDALDYNIKGDGSTNDSAAIQAFVNKASTVGAVAYFPALNFNMSNGVLSIPNGTTIFCATGATFIRSLDLSGASPYNAYTSALIQLGNNCHWIGGTISNTAVLATSTTSNTIGTGSKTFTTQTGLPITSSSFLRIWSRGSPSAKFEGLVSTYNSGTGALTLNASFDGGTGTHTDWNITFGAIWQCPLVLHGVTETIVEGVRVIGNWYVGLLMDGWNPSTGGSLVTNYCTFRNNFCEAVQNRAIYLYGTVQNCLIEGNVLLGSVGVTDYTFNMNPANATGTVNNQQENIITGNRSVGAAFQGFAVSDLCSFNLLANNTAIGMINIASVGFLVQLANGQIPQQNMLSGNIARSCPGFGLQIVGANYTNVSAFSAIVCGTGISVGQSGSSGGAENNVQNIIAEGNTNGVVVNAGAVNTYLSGRSVANTANLTDNGTGTVHGGLIVT